MAATAPNSQRGKRPQRSASHSNTPLPSVRCLPRSLHSQSPFSHFVSSPVKSLATVKTLSVKLKPSLFYPAPLCNSPYLQSRKAGPCISVAQVVRKSVVGSFRGMNKPQNQDSWFEAVREGCTVLGVCDGHGSNGQLISTFLSTRFPSVLFENLRKQCSVVSSLRTALLAAYRDCSKLLQDESIDTSNSGSTCLTVALQSNALACANVGDSRAVMGRCTRGVWSVFQLSWDHKPEVPEEQQRIEKSGGEVMVSKTTHSGPPRVYLKNKMTPGLAMSRSMGDDLAASAGVISEPDIEAVALTPNDRFIVLASDGLWEVMSSLEAVQRVASTKDNRDSACDMLICEAQNRWRRRGTIVDDVTVVIAFLHP